MKTNSISVGGGYTGVKVVIDGDESKAVEVSPMGGQGFNFRTSVNITVLKPIEQDAAQEAKAA